ncbi:DUF3800 domain-containing protein [Nocardioides montaniterrae]
MLIAYIDESGDTGDPALQGSSGCFVLGCVLIDSADWATAFDHLVGFRRQIKSTFGPLMRQELKANHLIRNAGGLRPLGLSPGQRQLIYAYHLNQLSSMKARAFAVVVDKAATGAVGSQCLDMAWGTLLQRLERTTHYENTDMLIVHDEGEDATIRKFVRKSRRHMTSGSYFGGTTFNNPFRRLIEDPSSRASHESYFLQLADLVAYAGWRTYVPPGPGPAKVVPATMWAQLGPAAHSKVNGLSRIGAPGVVIRK